MTPAPPSLGPRREEAGEEARQWSRTRRLMEETYSVRCTPEWSLIPFAPVAQCPRRRVPPASHSGHQYSGPGRGLDSPLPPGRDSTGARMFSARRERHWGTNRVPRRLDRVEQRS
ncbi:hypothetical protein [Caudoviricetes sp.]|nr:hypothetical protein [Caudoviricetes sp.]UOF79860.1 hypothetical protein [Bacteriophage sp.]